jgi:hypothetical protein
MPKRLLRTEIRPNTPLRDLFRWYAIPPSNLHETVQLAARAEGWLPPWEQQEQQEKRSKAGKRSAMIRGGRAEMRRSIIAYARTRLRPRQRSEPYSNTALTALRAVYDDLLRKNANDPDAIVSGIHSVLSPTDLKFLKKASDDTLLADLKLIRKRERLRR